MKRLICVWTFIIMSVLSCSSPSSTPLWLNGRWESSDDDWFHPLTVWIDNGKYRIETKDGVTPLQKIKITNVKNDGVIIHYFHDYSFVIDYKNHDLRYDDEQGIQWSLRKVTSKDYEKTKNQSIHPSYKLKQRRNKIERRLLKEYNNTPDKVLSFSTNLRHKALNGDIFFSMTPNSEDEYINEGYCAFWAFRRTASSDYYRIFAVGEYELEGGRLRLFNVQYTLWRGAGGAPERKYTLAFEDNTISLKGEYISYEGGDLTMMFDRDLHIVSRDAIINKYKQQL